MDIKKLTEELEQVLNEVSDNTIKKVTQQRNKNYWNAYDNFFNNDGSPEDLKRAKRKSL